MIIMNFMDRIKKYDIDDILKISIRKSVFHRLPWLIIGLIGGILTARIVDAFEVTLEKNIFLAAFIPLIVYMSDAVGTQMEAFAIRDFAIQSHLDFIRYFVRQMVVVTLIGFILSIGLFGICIFLLDQGRAVGLVLGISLFAAVMSSLLTGLFIPYIFRRIRLDPANASGPIATIIQDLISVMIYLSIAQIFLG
jgi:magnesium transporter